MDLSRRDLLRIGSSILACGIAFPISRVVMGHAKPAAKKVAMHNVEVHFTGKHAYAALLDKAESENWKSLPMGDLMGTIATNLLGTPYVNYTLDHSADHEFCIVNLQELDCVTFVESVLALARVIKLGETSQPALARQIELIRYRGGDCDGFCSRLHYLSDWFYDNNKKGVIRPYTTEIKGWAKASKDVCLMSKRPQDYKQLRAHPELVPFIKEDEKAINSREMDYLPKSKIRWAEQFMETGDVIAIVTEAKILDCAHTGLCYRDDKGVLRFLHASLTHRQVWLDQELADYMDRHHLFTGIMVARPIDPSEPPDQSPVASGLATKT